MSRDRRRAQYTQHVVRYCRPFAALPAVGRAPNDLYGPATNNNNNIREGDL